MTRKAVVAMTIVVGALLCFSAAGAQYQPGSPGLILVPSETTPGKTVEAVGFGCAKNVVVTLRIEGRVVGTGVTGDDTRGSFDVKFPAPQEPGIYVVVATCRATSGTGETVVSSTLTVVAEPTTTTSIIVVDSLPISGSGDSTMFLFRLGLGLIAVGGLIVLVVRRKRDAMA